jgi:hypothetical protein
MATASEAPAQGSPGSLNPITAPEAARMASLSLAAAAARARTLTPEIAASALVEIAQEWRHLAVSLSQHQAMTPRPERDDR